MPKGVGAQLVDHQNRPVYGVLDAGQDIFVPADTE